MGTCGHLQWRFERINGLSPLHSHSIWWRGSTSNDYNESFRCHTPVFLHHDERLPVNESNIVLFILKRARRGNKLVTAAQRAGASYAKGTHVQGPQDTQVATAVAPAHFDAAPGSVINCTRGATARSVLSLLETRGRWERRGIHAW